MAANQLTLFSFSTTTQTIPFIVCLKIWLFFLSNIFCNRCLQTKLNITIFYSIVYVARSLCTKVISNCSIYLDGYSDSRFNICMNKLMPTQWFMFNQKASVLFHVHYFIMCNLIFKKMNSVWSQTNDSLYPCPPFLRKNN